MTKAEQFREYAKEAIAWSSNAKKESDRLALIQLASTWTQVAAYRDRTAEELAEYKTAA